MGRLDLRRRWLEKEAHIENGLEFIDVKCKRVTPSNAVRVLATVLSHVLDWKITSVRKIGTES